MQECKEYNVTIVIFFVFERFSDISRSSSFFAYIFFIFDSSRKYFKKEKFLFHYHSNDK